MSPAHVAVVAPPTLARVALDPADLERGMVRLVLTLVEFLRRLMEAQALRRFEQGGLAPAEVEALGQALAGSEDAVRAICERMDIDPESLNLDLGPLGRLI